MDAYLKELEAHLAAACGRLREELHGVRSSRPSTELVGNLKAEYAGEILPVKQLGSLSIKPPREIDITVWDQAAVHPIMKAIEEARIGLSVSGEGKMIRAFLPPLTEERRAELTKLVKRTAETIRISIRTHRDDVQKKMKAAEVRKELSEDQMFKGKEKVQKLVDDINRQIEAMVENKLKELRE